MRSSHGAAQHGAHGAARDVGAAQYVGAARYRAAGHLTSLPVAVGRADDGVPRLGRRHARAAARNKTLALLAVSRSRRRRYEGHAMCSQWTAEPWLDCDSPYRRPRRNLPPRRNPVSTIAASTEDPRRGRGVAATRLRGRPPRNNTSQVPRPPDRARLRRLSPQAVLPPCSPPSPPPTTKRYRLAFSTLLGSASESRSRRRTRLSTEYPRRGRSVVATRLRRVRGGRFSIKARLPFSAADRGR